MTLLWAVGGAVGGLASGVALRELVNRFTRTGIALPLVSAAVLAVLAVGFTLFVICLALNLVSIRLVNRYRQVYE